MACLDAGSQIIYYRAESTNKQPYYKPSQENIFISGIHDHTLRERNPFDNVNRQNSKKLQSGHFSGRKNESIISSHPTS
jgi:hypothetical protein